MKNVKAMNGPRFRHYWIYILGLFGIYAVFYIQSFHSDLHNHHVTGTLGTLLNPTNPARVEAIVEAEITELSNKVLHFHLC